MATRCTDGVKFGREEGHLLRAKFHPHRCNDKGVGPQKVKFLLIIDQNVEYKRTAGAYLGVSLGRFSQNLQSLYPFQDALAKISLDFILTWNYSLTTGRIYVLRFGLKTEPKVLKNLEKYYKAINEICIGYRVHGSI